MDIWDIQMGQADTAQDLWEICAFLEQSSEIPCASSLTESSLLGGNKFSYLLRLGQI